MDELINPHNEAVLSLASRGERRVFLTDRLLQIVIEKDGKPVAVINRTSLEAAPGYLIKSIIATPIAVRDYPKRKIRAR